MSDLLYGSDFGAQNVHGATITATGALNALNAAVTVEIGGNSGVGAVVAVGTLTASTQPEQSFDNGVTWWPGVYSLDPNQISWAQAFSFSNPNATQSWSFPVSPGATHARLRVIAYTSGTANATLVATNIGLSHIVPVGYNGVANNRHTLLVDGTGRIIMAPAQLSVTATGTTGAAVTATLPAASGVFGGIYHYITSLQITAYSTAARTGGVTPNIVTSTNLPGSNAWTFSSAAAIGTTDEKSFTYVGGYKSAAAGTNTTIVCPATTAVIWRINVVYFVEVN